MKICECVWNYNHTSLPLVCSFWPAFNHHAKSHIDRWYKVFHEAIKEVHQCSADAIVHEQTHSDQLIFEKPENCFPFSLRIICWMPMFDNTADAWNISILLTIASEVWASPTLKIIVTDGLLRTSLPLQKASSKSKTNRPLQQTTKQTNLSICAKYILVLCVYIKIQNHTNCHSGARSLCRASGHKEDYIKDAEVCIMYY